MLQDGVFVMRGNENQMHSHLNSNQALRNLFNTLIDIDIEGMVAAQSARLIVSILSSSDIQSLFSMVANYLSNDGMVTIPG